MTKSDILVGFSLPKANASANFVGEKPYKRRSLDATKWTKFDWIEFEQPLAGPKGKIYGSIL